jgi:hypothetical protein
MVTLFSLTVLLLAVMAPHLDCVPLMSEMIRMPNNRLLATVFPVPVAPTVTLVEVLPGDYCACAVHIEPDPVPVVVTDVVVSTP